MVLQKDEEDHHEGQSKISGELDCEQESAVKRHGSSSKCHEADIRLKNNGGESGFCRRGPASTPASHSHQKTLQENYSHSKSVERRSESDISAPIAEINSTKISSSVGRDSPLHINEEDNEDDSQEMDEETIVSENGVAAISNVTAPVCSDDSSPRNKSKEGTKSPSDPDKEMINSEVAEGSCETEEIQTVKVETDFTWKESSRPQMAKNGDTRIFGFDLNEDLPTKAMEDSYVIRVAAKAGIPKGLPVFPLKKFEGRKGWRGPSKTSAFRVVVPKTKDRKTCPRTEKLHLGFDLNVALWEDDHVTNGLIPESMYMSEPQDSQVDDTVQTKRLKNDLIYDPIRPSLGPTEDSLNASTAGKSNSTPWLAQVCQSYGSPPGFKYASNHNWADLRTMQSLSHQTLPLITQNTLPPHHYLSTVPFHFCSRIIRASWNLPYDARYSQEQGISPQLLNPGIAQRSFGAPRFLNSSPSPAELGVKRDHDEDISANGSKKLEAVLSLSLGQNYSNGLSLVRDTHEDLGKKT